MQATASSLLPKVSATDINSQALSVGGSAEEVAQSFESVFASMLVKEIRSTLSEGLFGSEQSDVFGGLFDLHIGQAMTEGRGMGIREMVLKQMDSPTVPPTDSNPRTKA